MGTEWSASNRTDGKNTVILRCSVAGEGIAVEAPSKSRATRRNLLDLAELVVETTVAWPKLEQSWKIAGGIGAKYEVSP
ncbi:hypothetical protein ACYEXS_31335 [Paenibacillus sp. MAH-36]|uniref:Uncharacterized protein n=1 Tax=Paenibacillus violae TaxID=3077234 RepID=A0ABU3RNA9_9BACL|nr:hypothetical protein [Paenibacillus sp. PFR10]MDU0205776.1 hypothetical protein [Paenibacillus sp. PFR10]